MHENEWLFLLQIFSILFFLILGARLGRGFLSVIVVMQVILANLFILKQIDLFGFQVTSCEAYTVGAILGLNLLQEFYGKEAAKKCALYTALSFAFFIAMSRFHLLYTPNTFDYTHYAFNNILDSLPYIGMTSLAVFFTIQFIDIKLFGYLKKRFPKLNLTIRIFGSLILVQFLDTFLFGFIGLRSFINNLFHVVLVSFSIKMIVIILSVPFTTFVQKWIPSKYNIKQLSKDKINT